MKLKYPGLLNHEIDFLFTALQYNTKINKKPENKLKS